jgi:hypothetical protein
MEPAPPVFAMVIFLAFWVGFCTAGVILTHMRIRRVERRNLRRAGAALRRRHGVGPSGDEPRD